MDASPRGPVTVMTTAQEELRVLGRTVTSTVEITETGDMSFRWRVRDGFRADGSRRVEPVDEGTCRLLMEKTIDLEGITRFLRPLVAGVVGSTERGDVRRAAALLEARGQRG